MELKHQLEYLQAQRASELFENLKQGRTEDVAAFQEWCRQSSLHTAEFLEIAWADRVLDDIDPRREKDVDSLLRQINPQIATLPSCAAKPAPARQPAGRQGWHWGLAAAVMASAIGLAFLSQPGMGTEEFSTAIGEQHTVALRDRSTVILNTNSEIEVKFERGVRNIELHRGEALFEVAHDAARPFRVNARMGVVQAIGTQFNVYDRPDGTTVTVLEGRVRLTPYRRPRSRSAPVEELTAGQEARIASDGSIYRAEHADVGRVVAWSRQGRLKFDDVSLEEMAREFNRYHRNVQVRLEGVPAGSHHYSGLFDTSDPNTLVRFLNEEHDLTVEQAGSEIVIRPRSAATGARATSGRP